MASDVSDPEISNMDKAIIDYTISFENYSNGFTGLKYKLEASCEEEYNAYKNGNGVVGEPVSCASKSSGEQITSNYLKDEWQALQPTDANDDGSGNKNQTSKAPNSGTLATGKLKAQESAYLKFSIYLPLLSDQNQNSDQGKKLSAKLKTTANVYVPNAS